MKKQTDSPTTVDAYLAELPDDVREALQRVREIVHAAVPNVTERISYKIPVFAVKRDLVGMASQKKHCSFYSMSPPLMQAMANDLGDFRVSGSTIHFTPDRPLPTALIKKILKARLKELSQRS